MTKLTHYLQRAWTWIAHWFSTWVWGDLLFPFLLTRLALVLAARFARDNYQPNPTYAEYAQRGWMLSKFFLLDIWSHWDAKHYLQIINQGYTGGGDLANSFTNLPFFPLYPYLVKGLTWLLYGWTGGKTPDSLTLLVGIVLSNLLFLAGAVMLHELATRHLGIGENAARRALWLLLLFPTSFIFSSFYTESLFFFLAVAAFSAAVRRRWLWAGLCGGLLTLTRPPGILAAAALGLVYLQQREWKLNAVRADILWLGMAPLLLLAHLYNLYLLTGSFLAPLTAQNAWGRNQYTFLEGMRLQLEAPLLDVFKFDGLFALLFLGCGIYILWKWPQKALGVYAVLLVLMPIATGMLISAQRFMLVIFPVFLLFGEKIQRPDAYDLTRWVFFTLQVVYFTGWVNYYWIA